MLRLLRMALQVVIFFLLLSVIAGLASGDLGGLEKVALAVLGASLIWVASRVRRLGRASRALG